ncbi:hypothetical protein LFM09_33665 [Lentzea alba]|uniref:hypothetical protein n=1 Tax=Lentzea alba TaxID=2714351 RepID=UPI0039BF30AD
MTEHPVPPLLPPELPARHLSRQVHAPVKQGRERSDLLLGTVKVDHSGRAGDRVLLDALGWQPGDRHDVRLIRHGAELYRSPAGRFRVDIRGNVFLPAATRTMLGIHSGDRIVLVASLSTNTLLVHPITVVTSLLAGLYRESAAGDSHVE